MNLPNGANAFVDISKLRDYCLSFDHLRGRNKARVFASALGMTAEHAEDLRNQLLEAARTEDATELERDEYGQRFEINSMVTGPKGSVRVRSGWIVRGSEDFPD